MRKLLNILSSRLAKLEGKKSQVKIGDMREILAVLKQEIKADPKLLTHLMKYLVT